MKTVKVPIKYIVRDSINVSFPDEIRKMDELISILNKVNTFKKLKQLPIMGISPFDTEIVINKLEFLTRVEQGLLRYEDIETQMLFDVKISFIKPSALITLAGVQNDNFITLIRYKNDFINVRMVVEDDIYYAINFQTQAAMKRDEFIKKFNEIELLLVEWRRC